MARTKSGERKKREAKQVEDQEEQEFEIEKITNKRGENKTLQYCVKWKGYPESDNTWENFGDLPKNLVKKYEDSISQAEESPRPARQARSKAQASPRSESPSPKRSPKKSPKKTPKKSPKKSPKKAVRKDPEPINKEIVGRQIRNNVVHYQEKGSKKFIPIYDFTDFEKIFEFEMVQTKELASAQVPIRVVEKKGEKYYIEWQRGTKSWEDRRNLACVKLMNEFDDREDEEYDEDEIEYTVKKIIGKRKNGRVYEYHVIWAGHDEDTATWEPEENLENCGDKIRKYEKEEQRAADQRKAKKDEKAEKRRNASPSKSGSTAKRGRPKKV